ncbi:FHA containing domain protein [Mycobacterium kansasii]|uniref:FHA containing domain protein n=1 Tax=Mycobacterium kansasii TaxID=1768 RepID=A0A1V3WZK3_MYCKA|nr:FHA containing domain protein [Mycobacterium kansasii]
MVAVGAQRRCAVGSAGQHLRAGAGRRAWSPGPGRTRTGTSGGTTGGVGGGGGPSSGSFVFSGGGGTPSAGLGVPTTTQLPSGA